MGFSVKTAAGLGLAAALVLTGANAQEVKYVDVEAERKAQAAGQAVAPAQAASDRFALGKAAPQVGQTSAPPVVSTSSASSSDRGALFRQIQQLRQEVMQLNGRVEELSYEVRRLKSDNLERYKDIDRRLSGGAAPAVSSGASTSAPPAAAKSSGGSTTAQAGETQAYRAAYGLVRQQDFAGAVKAFKQFLVDYPAGFYAPNAHYWLGELYLVVTPPDLESSRRAFSLLLDQYPGHSKEPDALFKLGKVHYLKGNPKRGKAYLDRLLRDYGSSNSSAVKLARQFLKDNA